MSKVKDETRYHSIQDWDIINKFGEYGLNNFERLIYIDILMLFRLDEPLIN